MTYMALLNNVDHHDLKVRLDRETLAGSDVNQAPIFPTEFADAQREFPILLRRDLAGAFQAVVLLGLDRDENLFLDERGWRSRYVPAVLQRGPFKISLRDAVGGQPAEPMIHVDLDHPAVDRVEGAPLFLDHGGNAPYLDHVARVLRRIHEGHAIAPALFAALDESGLIESALLQISLDETTRYDLPDFYRVDIERLATLDGATLERLNRAGFLGAAFMIAGSLANVSHLIELKNRRRLEKNDAHETVSGS